MWKQFLSFYIETSWKFPWSAPTPSTILKFQDPGPDKSDRCNVIRLKETHYQANNHKKNVLPNYPSVKMTLLSSFYMRDNIWKSGHETGQYYWINLAKNCQWLAKIVKIVIEMKFCLPTHLYRPTFSVDPNPSV